MKTTKRLASVSRTAGIASLALAVALTACAPAQSDYEGDDRSGLTEEVDARSPVMPSPDDSPQ